MRKLLTSLIFLPMSAFVMTYGQAIKPQAADSILKTALHDAASSNKSVMVIFHASWCSWCRRLDAALEDPAIKKPMEENYVIVRLDVLESGEKVQTLENPGGRKIMAELGGEKSGLPFYAFVDAKGKKLADSNVMPKGQNIGYPASTEEITEFVGLLKKTGRRLSAEQLTTIVSYLRKNAPH